MATINRATISENDQNSKFGVGVEVYYFDPYEEFSGIYTIKSFAVDKDRRVLIYSVDQQKLLKVDISDLCLCTGLVNADN